jgi:hypothetical protein
MVVVELATTDVGVVDPVDVDVDTEESTEVTVDVASPPPPQAEAARAVRMATMISFRTFSL